MRVHLMQATACELGRGLRRHALRHAYGERAVENIARADGVGHVS